MSTQHTPGPWRVIIDDCGYLAGRPSISASDELDCDIVHGAGFVQEFWRSARGDKEIQANARLIAAAPELLVALHALESFYPSAEEMEASDEYSVSEIDWVEIARAAITKATGEKE